jgi:hypothetical protein
MSARKTKDAPALKQEIKRRYIFLSSAQFSCVVTILFFLIALAGIFHHEMWRDEHQAWLVARDADSLSELLVNMKYEGNPALWHMFLYFITMVTHDPAWMQAFHLIIASAAVFVFNRYAEFSRINKVLFTFGYFISYEYAIISRSYVLGVLIIFLICALYRNRKTHYLLLGILLALLSNVTVFGAVISIAFIFLLCLDYFLNAEKPRKLLITLSAGIAFAIAGIAYSIYQVLPASDNTFPAFYAEGLLDPPRWGLVLSRLFTTYFYLPGFEDITFWNTNAYFRDVITIDQSFSDWVAENQHYYMGYMVLPLLVLFSAITIFLRKPLILITYLAITFGLFSVYYYTGLMYMRYCGYLFIGFVACYWLSSFYPDYTYKRGTLKAISSLGEKLKKPFLKIILCIQLFSFVYAWFMDLNYSFSPGMEAADYIRDNKLDTLEIVGVPDFAQSPIASYLDKKIWYPQMQDYGSFTIYNGKRSYGLTTAQLYQSAAERLGNKKAILVINNAPLTSSGFRGSPPLQHGMLMPGVSIDFLNSFEEGIVEDEKYYLYLVQRTKQ